MWSQLAVSLQNGNLYLIAIIALGFIGTVLGLSSAIGNFQGVMGGAKDIDALMGSLGGVTSGLGTSFDTTLLGLIYSMILSFPMSALARKMCASAGGGVQLSARYSCSVLMPSSCLPATM